MALPQPLTDEPEGSWFEGYPFDSWLSEPPDDVPPFLFTDWAGLVAQVPDLGARLATWESWQEEHSHTGEDLAAGALQDEDLEPENPQPNESLEDWCSRIVADSSMWDTDEDCLRVAPDGTVAQFFCFSGEEHLTVMAVRDREDGSLHLFTFCPV